MHGAVHGPGTPDPYTGDRNELSLRAGDDPQLEMTCSPNPNSELSDPELRLDAPMVFAVPILPGKAEAWLRFGQEIEGRRREQYEDSRSRHEVTRESFWLVRMPHAELGVIYLDADEPEDLFRELAASEHPFDRWFREQLRQICGLELEPTAQEPEMQRVFHWKHAN